MVSGGHYHDIKERKPSVLNKLKEAAADAPSKAPTKKKEVEL